MDKTLGQIAFEAGQQWYGSSCTWTDIPPNERAYWEAVARAVAQAVVPVPDLDA